MEQSPPRRARKAAPRLDKAKLRSLYQAEHKPGHTERWEALAKCDPELIRYSLVRAHAIRSSGADAGDAYLQAVAETYALLERQRLLGELQPLGQSLVAKKS